MSFRGQLRRLGIDTDGKDVEIFDGDLTLKTDHKLYFRDSGCYIYSNADGYLTIEADTGLVIAADLAYTGTLAFTTTDDTALTVAATGTALTGTLRSIDITHTQTGASYVTKLEVIKATIASSVMTGDWANAIYGVITYTSPGTAGGGMAAAICAEVNLPAQNVTSVGGVYTLFHGYLGLPANCVMADTTTHAVSLLRLEAGGSAVATFDSYGYLMQVTGLTAGDTKLLSENSRTLKILVGSTKYYLPMSTTANNLTFAGGTSADAAIVIGTTGTGIQVDGTPAYAVDIYADVVTGSYTNIGAFNCRTTIAAGAVVTSSSFTNAAYCRLELAGAATVSGWNCAIMGYTKQVTGACVAVGSRIVAAIVGGINLSAGYVDVAGETACFIAYSYSNVSATVTPYYPAFYVMDSGLKDFSHGFRVGTYSATNGMLIGTVTGYGITIEGCATGIVLSGAMTDGIVVSGACSDNAIEITGACDTGEKILITDSTATTSLKSIYLDQTCTYEGGNHIGIMSQITWTPTTGTDPGGSAIRGKYIIDGRINATSWVCALQGELRVATGSVIDGGSSILSAIQAFVCLDSDSTLTQAHIVGVHIAAYSGESLDQGGGHSTYIWCDGDNSVGQMEAVLTLSTHATPYLISAGSSSSGGIVGITGAGGATRAGWLKIYIDGTARYISFYTD